MQKAYAIMQKGDLKLNSLLIEYVNLKQRDKIYFSQKTEIVYSRLNRKFQFALSESEK